MEFEEDLLTVPINPNNFPAKLWRLVNCPKTRSIRWDACGQGVMIDQQLFEAELLSPMKPNGEAAELFKTTNFTSFIRQLNLYGFRKVVLAPGNAEQGDRDDKESAMMEGVQHHFHNPNFKKDHPGLLVNLKRLTSTNKAKLEAGLEVNCRPPSRFRRQMGTAEDNDRFEKQGPVYHGPIHRALPRDKVAHHPYHRALGQPKEYDRTPIPARGWLMGHGDASSPTTFYTDKGVPVSVIRRYMMDPAQSSPTTVHVQQGAPSVSINGQKLSAFHPHHPQYRPGFYSSVCQCCTPGNMDNEVNSSVHHQAPSFPHYNFYPPNYQVGFLHPGGNQNQEWQNTQESQDPKKNDVNLDTVFQIVDELQASPKLRLVKVETPEKQYHASEEPHHEVIVHGPSDQGAAQCDAAGGSVSNTGMPVAMDSTTVPPYGPVPMGGIIIAVPGNVSSGIAITVGGNTTTLADAASGENGELRLALPELTEYPSAAGTDQVSCSDVGESAESSDNAQDNEIVATINFSDLAASQEDESRRKQSKSPDLNMLVEVACNQDS